MATKSKMTTNESSQKDKEPQASPLTRKLHKILDTKLENDPGTLDALQSLSEFFTENNLNNRRNLRGDMEKRSLRHNEDFCKCLQSVKAQLDEIHHDIEAISSCHRDMTQRLHATRSVTTQLVQHTTQLRANSKEVDMRSKVATAFMAKYQLSQDEMEHLKGRPGQDISAEFFSALQRVRQVHEECKALMRTSQQRLGLQIMERMAMHQEAAVERLYHWLLTQIHSSCLDSPDLPLAVRQGLLSLQERPILFEHCVSELSQARRSSLVQGFIDALTRGGAGGVPRPIELFSHDALRYVGDMFGWLHQALASERDFLVGIFGKMDDKIPATLAQVSEGVCRPLRVRVEQVIVSDLPPSTAFRVATLLRFYRGVMEGFVPPQALLATTCREVCQFSMRMFISGLHASTTRLLMEAGGGSVVEQTPSADLGPLRGFKDTLRLLSDILGNQDLSKVPDRRQPREGEGEDSGSDLQQVFTAVVEPLLQFCNETATKLTSPPSTAVYLLNCLYALHSTLALYDGTEEWLEKLQAQQQAYVDMLVDHQASHYLVASKLAELYRITDRKPLETQITDMPGYEEKHIHAAAGGLSEMLSAPDRHLLSQCGLLQSPSLRASVQGLSVDMFVRCYTAVLAALEEDGGTRAHIASLPDPLRLRQLLN